ELAIDDQMGGVLPSPKIQPEVVCGDHRVVGSRGCAVTQEYADFLLLDISRAPDLLGEERATVRTIERLDGLTVGALYAVRQRGAAVLLPRSTSPFVSEACGGIGTTRRSIPEDVVRRPRQFFPEIEDPHARGERPRLLELLTHAVIRGTPVKGEDVDRNIPPADECSRPVEESFGHPAVTGPDRPCDGGVSSAGQHIVHPSPSAEVIRPS